MPTTEEPDDAEFFHEPEFAWKIDKKVARGLGRDEVRYLVGMYYDLQEMRKSTANQDRALDERAEPSVLATAYAGHFAAMESKTQALLREWCLSDPLSRWAIKAKGLGPVIVAGLASHIDLSRASSPSALHRFAGYDPSQEWVGRDGGRDVVAEAMEAVGGDVEAAIPLICRRVGMRPETLRKFAGTTATGEARKITAATLAQAAARRPWNAALKTLCWKLSDVWMKFGTRHPDSLYARLYREHKAKLLEKNDAGGYAASAKQTLADRKFGASDTRDEYEAGRWPAGRIDLTARRKAVRVFLSHYWTQGWLLRNPGKTENDVPRPWIIAHGGHVDLIGPEVPYEYAPVGKTDAA
jgi:hypothetical protein